MKIFTGVATGVIIQKVSQNAESFCRKPPAVPPTTLWLCRRLYLRGALCMRRAPAVCRVSRVVHRRGLLNRAPAPEPLQWAALRSIHTSPAPAPVARPRILMTMEYSKSIWFWFRQQICVVRVPQSELCIIAEYTRIKAIVYKVCIAKKLVIIFAKLIYRANWWRISFISTRSSRNGPGIIFQVFLNEFTAI